MENSNNNLIQDIQNRLIEEALENPILANSSRSKEWITYLSKSIGELYMESRLRKTDLYRQMLLRVFPEIWGRALPAHAPAQLAINTPDYDLSTGDTFTSAGTDLYFSPLVPAKLINTRICFHAVNGLVFQHKKSQKKTLPIFLEQPLPQGVILLGLKCHDIVDDLDGLTLYITGTPREKQAYLKFVQVDSVDDELYLVNGFDKTSNVLPPFPDHEYLRLEQLKNEVKESYKYNFFTLKTKSGVNVNWQNYNTATLKKPLTGQAILEKKPDTIWLTFRFPEVFTSEELAEVELRVNTVPTWNVRNEITHDKETIADGMTIPLTSIKTGHTEYFLGLQQVRSDAGPFQHSPIRNSLENTYRIQESNLGSLDLSPTASHLQDLVYSLTELQTSIEGKEKKRLQLSHVLHQLSINVDQLQSQIKAIDQEERTRSNYYLHLFPKNRGEMLYIESLMTQGDHITHRLWPSETELKVASNKNIPVAKAMLIGEPVGGRAPLTMNEKEAVIRNRLNNQIS